MTDHEKTSDAVKITKHLYGEPSQESRNELAADDLHEKLVAACEAVGMEAYSDDTTLDGEKRLPFSAPVLRQRLEGWMREGPRVAKWVKEIISVLGIEKHHEVPQIVVRVLKMTETQRTKALLAAFEKIREQK